VPINIEPLLVLQRSEAQLEGLKNQIIAQMREGWTKSDKELEQFATKGARHLQKLEDDAGKVAESIAREMKEAAEATEKEAKDLAEAYMQGLKQIRTEAQNTAEAVEDIGAGGASGDVKKILDIEQVNQGKEALGDLKDMVERMGPALLGMSEAQVETASTTADMAAKGAGVLSAFGPWGALLGGLAGGALGYFTTKLEEAAKAEEWVKEQTDEWVDSLRDLSGELDDFKSIDLEDLAKEIGRIKDSFEDVQLGTLAAMQASLLWEAISKRSAEGVRYAINSALFDPEQAKRSLAEIVKEYDEVETALRTREESIAADAAKGITISREEIDRVSELIVQFEALKVERKQAMDSEIERIEAGLKGAKKEEEAADKASKAHKKHSEEVEKSVADAFSPFARVLGQVADQSSEATGAMDVFVPSTKDATTELKKYIAAWQPFIIEDIPSEIGNLIGEFNNLGPVARFAFGGMFDAALEAGGGLEVVIDKAKALQDAATDAAMIIGNAFGDLAVQGLDTLLDRMQDGEALFGQFGEGRKKQRVKFLRETGHELVADGIKNELSAAAMAVLLDPRAPVLAGVGAAEIAVGIGMGATGAAIGRRNGIGSDAGRGASGGGGVDGGPSLRGVDSASGPQRLAPIYVSFNTTVPMTNEQQQEAANNLSSLLAKSSSF
jgi:hypothetical protein